MPTYLKLMLPEDARIYLFDWAADCPGNAQPLYLRAELEEQVGNERMVLNFAEQALTCQPTNFRALA